MKKLIILLIFSISITTIFADLNKLRIVDKAEKTNDIVPARYQTVNRERAACIIFITDLEVDLDFRPRLDLIALTNPAAGQFHVYIDPNERAIDVHALGYEPLIAVLSDYGIRRLRSSDVYRLRLTGDKKNQIPDTLPVVFNVTPADAVIRVGSEVFVSGQVKELLMGTNEVIIEKEGYNAIKDNITVSRTNILFTYQLQKKEHVLVKISTNPSNAQVYVNREIASNNTRLELVPGVYMIEIRADKHHSQTETIEIKLGDNISKSYTLEPQTGNLLLSTNPIDTKTEIYLDNQLVKTVTGSVRVSDLFIGDYVLKCSASGHKSKEFRVAIIENENKEFNLVLEKGSDSMIEMIFVEGGKFRMGSNYGEGAEKPVHRVTVSSFYIGKYEVTQKEWTEVMDSNPSFYKGDNLPVEQVSWYDAAEFCNKLSQKEGLTPAYTINGTNVTCNWNANGYRLPTEAEWEYAARGGSKSKGFIYAGSNSIDEVAWYDSNSGKKTQAVGTKQANELGIYDMSGNVWEWCWDLIGPYMSGSQTNPHGQNKGSEHILRGGSWSYEAKYCRITIRRGIIPGNSYSNGGFRLARSVE